MNCQSCRVHPRTMMFLFVTIVLILQGGCSMGYQYTSDYDFAPKGIVRVGDACGRDWQCIPNAFCRVQQSCWCEPNYSPSVDRATCHANPGAYCKSNRDCMTMSNAECVQGTCQCKQNYLSDVKNASNCFIKPSKPGDFCQRRDDCEEKMLKGVCENERCRCMGDYRFTNETNTCVQIRGIYQPCTFHYECHDPKIPDALFCQNRECRYTTKYLDSVSSAGSTGFSSTVLGISALSIISLARRYYF